MRLYLICDSEDTATGMRLAGIEGIITDDKEAVAKKLNELASDSEIGIILINKALCKICSEDISNFRKAHTLPLITEIPDRDSENSGSSVADYIRDSIGIRI